MKLTVIVDQKGRIVGTARPGGSGAGALGTGGPVAGSKQRVHEIDLPGELQDASPDELHKALKKHLQSRRKKS